MKFGVLDTAHIFSHQEKNDEFLFHICCTALYASESSRECVGFNITKYLFLLSIIWWMRRDRLERDGVFMGFFGCTIDPFSLL